MPRMPGSEEPEAPPAYGQRVSPEELAILRAEQGLDPLPEHTVDPDPDDTGPVSGWKAPKGGVRLDAWSRAQSDGAPAPRRRWRVLAVGLVLMLVVPVLLLVGALRTAVDWSGAPPTALGESGTVQLNKGTRAMVYAGPTDSTADCTITNPQGAAVVKEESGLVPLASFTASQAGAYTVTCSAGTEGMMVGPPIRAERIAVANVMIMGALLCGFTGLAVTVVGISRLRRGPQ